MSLACKARTKEQNGKRCDPPNETFTNVRELTNHLYSKHHVQGAEATIEARAAAAEAFPGRDVKPRELVADALHRVSPPPRALVAPVSPSKSTPGQSVRRCKGCGTLGRRQDTCPVCKARATDSTAAPVVSGSTTAPTLVTSSVVPPAPKPVTVLTSPARADVTRPQPDVPARGANRVTSAPSVAPEGSGHYHKRLNHLESLLRQATGVIDAATSMIVELRAGIK